MGRVKKEEIDKVHLLTKEHSFLPELGVVNIFVSFFL
jgi:hypothetical protein